MTLTLSGKKIASRLTSIFMFIVVFSIIFAFIPAFNNEFIYVILVFAIGVLPSIILFVQYLISSIKIRHAEFDSNGFKVLYKSGVADNYVYKDINVIELYKAAGMDKGSYSFNPNEQYYFAKIETKDGKIIILTSLMGPDLSYALSLVKDVYIDRTKTQFALISLSN
jgi:hypothetical protein